MQSDGSEMSAAINACTLALIAASVPLESMAIACTIGYAYQYEKYQDGQNNDTDCYLVDVTHQEGNHLDLPYVEISILPDSGKIVFLDVSGRLHDSCMPKMIDKALQVASIIREHMNEKLNENIRKVAEQIIEV